MLLVQGEQRHARLGTVPPQPQRHAAGADLRRVRRRGSRSRRHGSTSPPPASRSRAATARRGRSRGAPSSTAATRSQTNDGRAQIRFTDGSYVSLQPNTDFAISEYKFEGKNDGSERGFFGLVKGAMRTVTGAVGRVNRNAYRITTPTATVGIRGTGGVIQVLNDGSTLVDRHQRHLVAHQPGGLDRRAGGSVGPGADASRTRRRSETNTQPQTGPAPDVQPEQKEIYVQGNNVNPDGTRRPSAPSQSRWSAARAIAAVAIASHCGGSLRLWRRRRQTGPTATAVFDAAGQLTQLTSAAALQASADRHARRLRHRRHPRVGPLDRHVCHHAAATCEADPCSADTTARTRASTT